MGTGAQREGSNTKITGSILVELTEKTIDQFQRLRCQLHHEKRRLGAQHQALLNGGAARSLLLVGGLGHAVGSTDHEEGLGVLIDHIQKLLADFLSLCAGLLGKCVVLGILRLNQRQRTHHSGKGSALRTHIGRRGAATRSGRIGGQFSSKFVNFLFD